MLLDIIMHKVGKSTLKKLNGNSTGKNFVYYCKSIRPFRNKTKTRICLNVLRFFWKTDLVKTDLVIVLGSRTSTGILRPDLRNIGRTGYSSPTPKLFLKDLDLALFKSITNTTFTLQITFFKQM